MASDWIVVEARVSGCAAEVYVNDIPVAQVGLGQARSVALPVNQYVVKGENALLLVVNPGAAPASAREPREEPLRAGGATAVATLSRYRKGAVSGDGSGTVLATASWAGRADNEPEPFPQEVTASAEVPLELGPWAWPTADELALDDETSGRVAGVIDVVRSGLEAGDVSSFLELGTRGLREIARAYDDSPDEGVTTLREAVQHSRGAPHWKFPPLPRETWSLRLVAGNRMVECIARDWEPIVRSETDADENSFSMPMLVGRLGGEWVILR
jgi:hypothetical protein